jgi:hypothetical protein
MLLKDVMVKVAVDLLAEDGPKLTDVDWEWIFAQEGLTWEDDVPPEVTARLVIAGQALQDLLTEKGREEVDAFMMWKPRKHGWRAMGYG